MPDEQGPCVATELYACVVGEMSSQIVKRLASFDRKKAKRG